MYKKQGKVQFQNQKEGELLTNSISPIWKQALLTQGFLVTLSNLCISYYFQQEIFINSATHPWCTYLTITGGTIDQMTVDTFSRLENSSSTVKPCDFKLQSCHYSEERWCNAWNTSPGPAFSSSLYNGLHVWSLCGMGGDSLATTTPLP